ncbi:DUF6753 family protein [Brasilonema sp. UFV-L1]|uniref:DUF6753 family protein n=1 Tax=Brasilonema sp. UFV-L1 TaxID=2234130 RepID=UPI00145F5DB1|nr:DUF6753 family protein [Brasilonema sp. UFV-L1]NMG09749.1 hypothetical protein [Brasilonema sp. UFV-L1]
MEVKKELQFAKNNLAKALENESAEHRANVLQFVLDWNIRPDEEFFLIFAAIGHLKILIETAPEDIRQLFNSVLQELDEWSRITTEKLQIDTQHIKVTESLASSSKALGTALNSLDITSTQLLEQLKSLPELLRLLKTVAENLPSMSLQLEKLNQAIESGKQLRVELKDEQLKQLKQLIFSEENEIIKSLAIRVSTAESLTLGVQSKIQHRLEAIESSLQTISNQQNKNQQQNNLNLLGLLGKGGVGGWNYKLLGVFGGILVSACTGTAVITRAVFEVSPAPLPVAESEKIQYTREQAGYTNVKLQRVEKKLGTERNRNNKNR